MENFSSGIEYKVGFIIKDEITKQVYEVVKCEAVNGQFNTTIKKHNEYLENLKDALKVIKMHDKDLFMLENIVASLEDSIGG